MSFPKLLLTAAIAAPIFIVGVAVAAKNPSEENVTFNGHVGAILHERCASCHRPGEAGPFSLLTYEDAAKRAALIGAVTRSRYMPPWHAEPGYGEFKGSRRMTDSEVDLIAGWVDAGAPRGEGAAPAPPDFGSEWSLGEPDMIVTMEEPYTVPADGPDIYRNFPAKVATTEDKWIRAYQFRPLRRAVVHHSLFQADTSGRARELDAEDEVPGYSGMGGDVPNKLGLGGWAVGGQAQKFPVEAPLRLPAGSDFLFESHFHPSGKEEAELSSIGLYFTDKPATRTRFLISLPPLFGLGSNIEIPPGDSNYVIKESFTLPSDVDVYAATPHAHYIGKEFRGWAELPDGSEVPLIWIKDWDFAWQDMYVYEKPVRLPAGATIHSTIRYDNSAENPRNPSNPPQMVYWGKESNDEMGSIIFTVMPVNEEDLPSLNKVKRKLNRKHEAAAKEYRKRRPEKGLTGQSD